MIEIIRDFPFMLSPSRSILRVFQQNPKIRLDPCALAKLNRDGIGKGLARADLRSGDSMVVLFQRPKPPVDGDFIEREGATHPAFNVSREDFELAKQKMKDWGVRIHTTPAVDRPSGSGFYLFDSEDNLLQLYAPPK